MRITNGMMISNSLININKNKERLSQLHTQLDTHQKIQRPSEDPIVAVRALRLRTTYSEICQYLEKNIPDADSWMSTTDKAMEGIEGVLGDILEYVNEGANGYLQDEDKATIAKTLSNYRDQLFENANADYAGRTLFTGYKTDTTLTFTKDAPAKSFEITQSFKYSDIQLTKKVVNGIDISKISADSIGSLDVSSLDNPEYESVYRLRLGYDNLDGNVGDSVDINVSTKGDDGSITTSTISATTISSSDPSAYSPADNKVYFIKETGEYIFGKDAYADLENSESFDISYNKTGFKAGDLNPIHYFNCVDVTDPDNTTTYTVKNQSISYEVSFNQSINVNIQGKDVFQHSMTRDVDEILDGVNYAIEVQNKVNKIQELYDNATEGSTDKAKFEELLSMAKKELDYAQDNVNNLYSAGLTKFTKHKTTVSNARADIGARQKRLELTETRLTAQKTTVQSLKSTNEEVNVTNAAIELAEAESIYDASLAAAAKLVQKRLMDFL